MNNNLGKFIRKRRGNISLRDFASQIGISHTHLDSIEKGYDPRSKKEVNISLETLNKISKELNISIDCLNAMKNGVEIEKALEEYDKQPHIMDRKQNNYFSKNLSYLRKKNHISKTELAKKVNVNPSTISRWENGEMGATMKNITDVANKLNVSLIQIIEQDLEEYDKLISFNLIKRYTPLSDKKLFTVIEFIENNKEMLKNMLDEYDNSKSLLNKYLSGVAEPKSDKLEKLANALNVNPVWLMGYDVPISRDTATIKVELVGYEEIIKQLEHISSLLEKIN